MLILYIGTSAYQFHTIAFEELGFHGSALGLIMAMGALAGAISPIVNSALAGYFPRPVPPLLFYLMTAGVSLFFLPQPSSLSVKVLTYSVHTFSIWAVTPLHLSVGMEVCRPLGREGYFFFRALGTLGFMLGCLVCSAIVAYIKLPTLYFALASFYILTILTFLPISLWNITESLSTENKSSENFDTLITSQSPSHSSIYSLGEGFRIGWKTLQSTPHLPSLLFALSILCWGNTLAVSLMSNYLVHEFHASKSVVSWAWVISSGCEIPIMLMNWALIRKWGIRFIMGLGIGASVLRLILLAWAPNISTFFFALVLHGFFYAAYTGTIGIWIDKLPTTNRHAQQIFFSLLYMGIPLTVGSFSAGYIWEKMGMRPLYIAAALLGAIGGLLYLRYQSILPGPDYRTD